MKTQRRRGFTVVELVVVIAIIAVLAAVLIPTFTSIIKKANDSAYLQERTNQKIEDLAEKVDNANWLSWEDFEVKLSNELAKIDDSNKANVTAAVKAALDAYLKDNVGSQTGLTEAQVQKIIDKAMEGQLTQAQVEAIVKQAVASSSSTVDATTITAIVNAAVSKASQNGVTSAQMKAAINEALKSVNNNMTAEKVEKIVNDAIAAALDDANMLTAEEVENLIKTYYNNNKANAVRIEDSEIVSNGKYTLDESNVGKTVYLVTTKSVGTFTIAGTTSDTTVVIDAPNIKTVNVGDANVVNIVRTAMTSVHITGTVADLEINAGRVVLTSTSKVTGTITAAPTVNAETVVEIEASAVVDNPIVAEYQDNGAGTNDSIKVIDHTTTASVKLASSDELAASGTTTTNVTVENVSTAKLDNSSLDKGVVVSVDVVSGESTTEYVADKERTLANNETITDSGKYVARIGTERYETLDAAYSAAVDCDTIVLLTNIDHESKFEIAKSITIDGSSNKYSISASKEVKENGRALNVFGGDKTVVLKNLVIVGPSGASYERGVNIGDANMTVVIDNCVITCGEYAINMPSSVENLKLTIKNSEISGWAAINIWGHNNTVVVYDTTLTGTNDKNPGSSNGFATICFEADTTLKTDEFSSDNTITLERCTINAIETNSNKQSLVGFNGGTVGATDSILIANNCIFAGNSTRPAYTNNGGNSFKIDGNEMFLKQISVDVTSVVLDAKTATGTIKFTVDGKEVSFDLANATVSGWSDGTDYLFNYVKGAATYVLDFDVSASSYESNGGWKLYVSLQSIG